MKQINLYTGLFLILFTSSVFIGCDKEESLFGDRDVTSGMYELNVTSSGFVPAEGQSSENAEPINIPFVNDDAMGLVIVEGDKITHTRYMYKELLGKWSGDLTVKNPSAKIYAYYPYNEALEISSLNTQGTNAAEFFSQMIANFVPQADQSKAENFRKSNLMIGTASIDEAGKKISINMESAMALAVVKVDPNQNGIMSLESDPNYTWEVEAISSESLVPFYEFEENTFVSYILPETEQIVSTSSGRVTIPSISKSSYQECPFSLVHTLHVGDFFMKDGSLIGKDAILTEEQKTNCIGIVFQIDVNRIGQAEKKALKSKAHGLVLALKNASIGVTYSTEQVDVTDVNNAEYLEDSYNEINGLANTQAVYSLQDYSTKYPVFNAIRNFSIERPIDKTTEWFLPSIGQLWDMFVNLGGAPNKNTDGYEVQGDNADVSIAKYVNYVWKGKSNKSFSNVNNYLSKIPVSDLLGGNNNFDEFWTSSEAFNYSARKILLNDYDFYITTAPKEKGYKARPILAF